MKTSRFLRFHKKLAQARGMAVTSIEGAGAPLPRDRGGAGPWARHPVRGTAARLPPSAILLPKGPHKSRLPLADCSWGPQGSSTLPLLRGCGSDPATSGSAWPWACKHGRAVTVSSATLTPKRSTPLLSRNTPTGEALRGCRSHCVRAGILWRIKPSGSELGKCSVATQKRKHHHPRERGLPTPPETWGTRPLALTPGWAAQGAHTLSGAAGSQAAAVTHRPLKPGAFSESSQTLHGIFGEILPKAGESQSCAACSEAGDWSRGEAAQSPSILVTTEAQTRLAPAPSLHLGSAGCPTAATAAQPCLLAGLRGTPAPTATQAPLLRLPASPGTEEQVPVQLSCQSAGLLWSRFALKEYRRGPNSGAAAPTCLSRQVRYEPGRQRTTNKYSKHKSRASGVPAKTTAGQHLHRPCSPIVATVEFNGYCQSTDHHSWQMKHRSPWPSPTGASRQTWSTPAVRKGQHDSTCGTWTLFTRTLKKLHEVAVNGKPDFLQTVGYPSLTLFPVFCCGLCQQSALSCNS
ncbi:uncharacterized protein LOC134512684 [Chroicocephalus ridibundus]|uniref:uncharacterized protein LOC134512684 n=1 Tax=Chroicocephalus ridibundus TaxID=1192867 RepID=UPI002FDF001E